MKGEVIQLSVGSDTAPEKFSIHKDLLCHYSSFFKAETMGKSEISLPDDDPAVFECLVQWLYTGSYAYPKNEDQLKAAITRTPSEKVWVFAAKHSMPGLMNDAMDQLVRLYDPRRGAKPFEAHLVRYVYEHTTPSSKLRQFYIAAMTKADTKVDVEDAAFKTLWKDISDLPVDLLSSLFGSDRFRFLPDPFEEPGDFYELVPPEHQ